MGGLLAHTCTYCTPQPPPTLPVHVVHDEGAAGLEVSEKRYAVTNALHAPGTVYSRSSCSNYQNNPVAQIVNHFMSFTLVKLSRIATTSHPSVPPAVFDVGVWSPASPAPLP